MLLAVLALILGVVAFGCSAGPSATASTSTTSATADRPFDGTPLAWLTAEARPWNGRLNQDQAAVLSDSKATTGEKADTFFHRLNVACARMVQDASGARRVPDAPSAQLAQAWSAMTAETERYAEDCLTVTRTRTNASLTAWENDVKPMDAANSSLNTVVQSIRTAAAG